MVCVLIFHFMIKHYLLYRMPFIPTIARQLSTEIRSNPEQSPKKVRFSEEIEILGSSPEVKEVDLKSELLNYVQQYQETSPDSKADAASYEMDEFDELSKFFDISNNDNYVFTETPTQEDDLQMSALPLETDKFSKNTIEVDTTASGKTLSKNQWMYSNEKVMNGANMYDSVMGFDSFNMDSNFSCILDDGKPTTSQN
jgi:hypothetical protein